ncbi:hypothetical protein [Pandoraea sp. PE-S2R-1]|uniref:hypothetical protein n=1 Tax=Pandoraea sp. PE-S2R-1 TaxID=1986994 RepID=UPI0011317A5D|nr:hypothetical protein [Pandoraea sp. PE-S2R-1]
MNSTDSAAQTVTNLFNGVSTNPQPVFGTCGYGQNAEPCVAMTCRREYSTNSLPNQAFSTPGLFHDLRLEDVIARWVNDNLGSLGLRPGSSGLFTVTVSHQPLDDAPVWHQTPPSPKVRQLVESLSTYGANDGHIAPALARMPYPQSPSLSLSLAIAR